MSAPLNDDKNLNMRSQRIGNPSDGQKLSNADNQGNDTTSGMSLNSPVVVGPIKPVDRRTLAGSTPGDFRSGNLDRVKLPTNPGPREQMAGQQNSKFYNENGTSFQSNDSDADSDAGN